MHEQVLQKIKEGDIKSLSRAISYVENEQPGYEDLLRSLGDNQGIQIIGVTGPPGAGKSTLVDALIGEYVKMQSRIAVICIDPSSPFHLGALLGDRIRMSEWYSHPQVFIRSMATRGSVGGLSPKIIEITDLIKAARFDKIIVETVGVGQSEIEIAGLAQITLVVLVPESGDEIQTMKAGLMEIADIFVINKSDRPDADLFEKNLRLLLAPSFSRSTTQVAIVKTIATEKKGIEELIDAISKSQGQLHSEKHVLLLTEKAWQLLVKRQMKGVDKQRLRDGLLSALQRHDFNLYSFVENYA